MQQQLQSLKEQSATLMTQADALQKQRVELLPAAQQTLPDLDAIRTKMVDSLADNDEVGRRELSKVLTAAKIEAEAVQTAQNQIAGIVDELAENHRQAVILAEQIKTVQSQILEQAAREAVDEYIADARRLADKFITARETALMADSMSGKITVPQSVKNNVQFSFALPFMGVMPSSLLTINAGSANDPAVTDAQQAALALI